MAKQPAAIPNPHADIPLPDYAVEWEADAYRPKTLPEVYEPRIDPAQIFALPGQDDGAELFVVAHRCTQCARVRQTCSRGYPTCRRCAEKDLVCHPTEDGWVEVPVPRKKPALRQEVQALRQSLPDAPYYREHSKSVAKSMSVPGARESSSALRKGGRGSAGLDSLSPTQKGRRGGGGGGGRAGAKRGGRKVPVSPEQSDEEAEETSQSSSPARPADSTNMPSPTPASSGAARPHSTVTTRPLSVTYVTTRKSLTESQPATHPENTVLQHNTLQDFSHGLSSVPNGSSEPVTSGTPPSAAVPSLSQQVSDPANSAPLAPHATTPTEVPHADPSASTATPAANSVPPPTGSPSATSRLSIRVPPRVGVVPYGNVSAQRAAEQFLGISKPPSTSASKSASKARTSSVATLIGPAPANHTPTASSIAAASQKPMRPISTPAPATTHDSSPPAPDSAPKEPEKGRDSTNAAETSQNGAKDDTSCSFRLSATAWDTSAAAVPSTPAQGGNASGADSDTSSDEPLSNARRRSNPVPQASTSASASRPASTNGSAAARKRKRATEPSEDHARQLAPWWTHTPIQWFSSPYQNGVAGPSNGVMPMAIPFMHAPMHTLPQRQMPHAQRPQPPPEPFLSPLRPPLPSLQQRAERLAHVQQAPADVLPEVEPSTPTPEAACDSEEEVEQYLRRSRRKKSSSHSSSSRATAQEQAPLTFVPRQKILADTAAVMVESVLFHLPKSRLVQNSEFFARQLAKEHERDRDREGSSTDDEERTVDRCPVIKVTGVCAEDFEALLGVCDNLGSFLEKQPSFKTLAAVFCTARTLRFGQIDALATYKLTNMWPGDLHKLSPVRTPFAAETVVLARMYDMPAVLKRALYELLRSEGFAQQSVVGPSTNATTDTPKADGEAALDGSRLVGKAKLSHTDLVRLITTREKLSLAWTLLVGSPPSATSLPCMLQHTTDPNVLYTTNAARERCAAATRNAATLWAEWVLDSGLFETWMYDPVCGLERLSVLNWESSGLCSSCVMARRQLWSRKREEIWENLDVWLGL